MKMQRRGGKYVSRGSFGCIFSPPVRCENGQVTQGTVGKIFKHVSDAEQEESNHREVQRLDPHGVFTVRLVSKCVNVPKQAIVGEADAHACSFLQQRDTFTQIVYEYGGFDMNRFMEKIGDYKLETWAPALEGVFYGLCMLEKKGVVHNDLSAGNMLYDPDRNRFNIIDFGMKASASVHFTPDNDVYSHQYQWYPPEYKLMIPEVNSYDAFYERFRDNFSSSLGSLERFYGTDLPKDLLSLYVKFDKREVSRTQLFRELWNRSDMYAVGMIFHYTLTAAERRRAFGSETVLEALKGVVRGMIRMDPWRRFTPMKAFAAFHRMARKHLPGYRGVLYASLTGTGISRLGADELRAVCKLRGVACPRGQKKEIIAALHS